MRGSAANSRTQATAAAPASSPARASSVTAPRSTTRYMRSGSSTSERRGAVHQRDVRERLREVADLAAGRRVVLLGEQPDVVGERGQAVVQVARLLAAADARQ